MENLRAFAPLLAVLAGLVFAVGLVVIRLASFGKDIQQATHAKRRAAGGLAGSGGQLR